jgi:hypothetical protein
MICRNHGLSWDQTFFQQGRTIILANLNPDRAI